MVLGTMKGGGKYCALYASVDCGNGKPVILLGKVSLAPAHPASVVMVYLRIGDSNFL